MAYILGRLQGSDSPVVQEAVASAITVAGCQGYDVPGWLEEWVDSSPFISTEWVAQQLEVLAARLLE
jgi:hypothetical protein